MKIPITRRNCLKITSGALLSMASGGAAHAVAPLSRETPSRLKLGLAAYSFRSFLPSYRNGSPSGREPMDMLGFLDYAAGLDVDGVELTSYFLPHPCPDELALQIKRRALILGLDISGGAIGNNYSFAAGEELNKQFEYTSQWIRTYAALGAPVIRVFGGKPVGKKVVDEAAENNIIENLERACEIAAEHGVVLAVENHDFMTDIDRFLRVVQAVDSPWFGANLDSGNFSKTDDPYREFARVAPYAVNVQLKTEIPRNDSKEPADFDRLIEILREAKYSGYVVLEYEGEEDPYVAVPRHLAILRELIH